MHHPDRVQRHGSDDQPGPVNIDQRHQQVRPLVTRLGNKGPQNVSRTQPRHGHLVPRVTATGNCTWAQPLTRGAGKRPHSVDGQLQLLLAAKPPPRPKPAQRVSAGRIFPIRLPDGDTLSQAAHLPDCAAHSPSRAASPANPDRPATDQTTHGKPHHYPTGPLTAAAKPAATGYPKNRVTTIWSAPSSLEAVISGKVGARWTTGPSRSVSQRWPRSGSISVTVYSVCPAASVWRMCLANRLTRTMLRRSAAVGLSSTGTRIGRAHV